MTTTAIAPSTLPPLAMLVPQPTTITVTPQAASDAYLAAGMDGLAEPADELNGFGATLNRAIRNAIGTGHDADRKSMAAISGKGNITDVVTAVSKAQLTLQSAVTIRDKVVTAYQEIMRMSI